MPDQVGPPLELAAAAKMLRMTGRSLRNWLNNHRLDPGGQPYYSFHGRVRVLYDCDIARVRAAMREETRRREEEHCPPAWRPTKGRTRQSADLASEAKWARVAELTGDPSLAKPPRSTAYQRPPAGRRKR
jgi:hypothetical protein